MRFTKPPWRHGTAPLTETVNVVAATILGVAALLTRDPYLLGVGVGAEIIYLVCVSISPQYEERLQRRRIELPQGVYGLDLWLVFVTAAGVTVILFFGFGKHLLSHPWPKMTHAGGWEAGALCWTLAFLVYYAPKFFVGAGGKFSPLVVPSVVTGFLLVYFWFKAWYSVGQTRPLEHVVYVLLISVCLTFLDWVAWKKHILEKERVLSHASLRWADAPMLVAFLTLLLYLWAHHDAEHEDVFVSGVISCQLVISNVIFVVMEFGFLKLAVPIERTVTPLEATPSPAAPT